MIEPLISVVIPNYNYARFLDEATASVAAQTYGNIELVVADDGSSDGSLEVLANLQEHYDGHFAGGFHVIGSAVNEGAHEALNRGIAYAEGDIITILNADDLYEKDRLEKMERAMRETRRPFAFSAVRCIGKEGEPLESDFARHIRALPTRINDSPFAALAAIAENIAVSTGNMMFTRSLFRRIGPFRALRYIHDYDFLLRVLLFAEPIFVPDTTYLYRIHGENSFTGLQKIGIAENRIVWLETYARIKSGDVHNETILGAGDYRALFARAAKEYGFQKTALWHAAGTPAGAAICAMMEKTLKKHAKPPEK